MDVTLIVRLLADDGRVLGWGYQPAIARGDGALWPVGVCTGWGEATETATQLLVHWADVHVQGRAPIPPLAVVEGVPFAFQWQGGPMLRLDNPGDHPPLAALTMRGPVRVAVPVAIMGVRHA